MNHNATLSLGIMSGKGGVGKSSLSLNLALALQAKQKRLLLIDCDFGLANLDVLLGMVPNGTLQDVLLADADVRDIIQTVHKFNIDVLPAASGVPELVDLDDDLHDVLIRQLEPALQVYDYVFLDLGAGISSTIQAFACMPAARLVVVTPEPTALTDSYALIKVLAENHGVRDFFLVVNQVESRRDANITFQRLQSACRRFLDIEPVFLGSVRYDSHVMEAVRQQKPLVSLYPTCNAARDIFDIAHKLEQLRGSTTRILKRRAVLELLPM